jgi:hypothetical protein
MMLLALFRCSHPKLSRVFTMGKPKRTYKVCLECGRELEYDLVTMRLTGANSKLETRNLKLTTEGSH